MELSQEMETVAKRGGFEFKETLMSGDKEDENGELGAGTNLGD